MQIEGSVANDQDHEDWGMFGDYLALGVGWPLNRDVARRDAILGIVTVADPAAVTHFRDIGVTRLELLISEGFIALDQATPGTPTPRVFIDFMGRFPEARVHGYAVHPERDDYRITIEGIECDLSSGHSAAEWSTLRAVFEDRFASATTFYSESDWLYAWWD